MSDREQLQKPEPQSAPRRASQAPKSGSKGRTVEKVAEGGLSGSSGILPYIDQLEKSFGQPLGGIRAHQGPSAAEASEQLDAKGYATQGQVVLGKSADFRTVAEETGHALQQRNSVSSWWSQSHGITDPKGPIEADAKLAAENVVAGRPASVEMSAGPSVIAREELKSELPKEPLVSKDPDDGPISEEKPKPTPTPKEKQEPDVDKKLIESDPHEKKKMTSLDDVRNYLSNEPDVQKEKQFTDPTDEGVLKEHKWGKHGDPKHLNPNVKAFPPKEKPLPEDGDEKKKLDRIPRLSSMCLFEGNETLCNMEMHGNDDFESLHKSIFGKDYDGKKPKGKGHYLDAALNFGLGPLSKGLRGVSKMLKFGNKVPKGVSKAILKGSEEGLEGLGKTGQKGLGKTGKRKLVRDLEKTNPNSPYLKKKKLKRDVKKAPTPQELGRRGRQKRLKELSKDPKVGSADRGWLKQEINRVKRNRKNPRAPKTGSIRNPPGQELRHRYKKPAKDGHGYEHSDLMRKDTHKTQTRLQRRLDSKKKVKDKTKQSGY